MTKFDFNIDHARRTLLVVVVAGAAATLHNRRIDLVTVRPLRMTEPKSAIRVARSKVSSHLVKAATSADDGDDDDDD